MYEMNEGAKRANDLMAREAEGYDRDRIISRLDTLIVLTRKLLVHSGCRSDDPALSDNQPLPSCKAQRKHMDYCGLAADHEGKCTAVVTRMLGV